MKLDKNAINLISLFESQNYAAYAVGGCVRDALMSRRCNDTDIAVSCTPDITVSVLFKNNIRYAETGLKHGTVTAIVDDIPYEITTFRTDGEYTDSRHPDTVCFVDNIDGDLSRRDFTVNAMAYSPDRGLVDLFGGAEDIKNKIIRTVGDPDVRFSEDALRILRALRFSSVLGFEIESETARSVLKNRNSLTLVAAERIGAEMRKLIVGKNLRAVVTRFKPVFCDVLGVTDFDIEKMLSLPPDFCLRIASVCDGQRLVLSRTEHHRINTVRRNASLSVTNDISSLCRLLYRFGSDDLRDILVFNSENDALVTVDAIIQKNLPYAVSHLDLRGNDLVALGFRGADIKRVLESTLFAVVDGKVKNIKKNLLEYIGNM